MNDPNGGSEIQFVLHPNQALEISEKLKTLALKAAQAIGKPQ
jgi:D-alanine-D-alanine ligase-like ATP-grasp enzyme